jgi:hypothetical protein
LKFLNIIASEAISAGRIPALRLPGEDLDHEVLAAMSRHCRGGGVCASQLTAEAMARLADYPINSIFDATDHALKF